jgi:hypothetical protein
MHVKPGKPCNTRCYIAIHPKGFVQHIECDAYWRSLPVAFIALYLKRRAVMVFYDKTGEKWELLSLRTVTPISLLTRVFFGLRPTEVRPEFRSNGKYSLEDIPASMRAAVESDDDILTQFHDRRQVLAWIDKAESIPRMFNLYRWITKDFSRKPGKDGQRPEQSAPPNGDPATSLDRSGATEGHHR